MPSRKRTARTHGRPWFERPNLFAGPDGKCWVRSVFGTRYRAGMVAIRIDDQHPGVVARNIVQRKGAALERRRPGAWERAVRERRWTGVPATKEPE
jgi:hypothetical protein